MAVTGLHHVEIPSDMKRSDPGRLVGTWTPAIGGVDQALAASRRGH